MTKLFLLLLVSTISNAQINGNFKSYEISFGPQASNAKYPNGVGVSYSSGATEVQSLNLGWHLRITKILKTRSPLFYEPGLSLKTYSYGNRFNYPIDYTTPRVLHERYNYFFASLDNRILMKLLDRDKIRIFPYVGFCVNLLLDSRIRKDLDINGQKLIDYSNLTKNENALNFNYEAGIKLVLIPQSRHPITVSTGYTHFLKEQFALGAGKIIYAFGFGVGYQF